jgi:nonstructural protein NSm
MSLLFKLSLHAIYVKKIQECAVVHEKRSILESKSGSIESSCAICYCDFTIEKTGVYIYERSQNSSCSSILPEAAIVPALIGFLPAEVPSQYLPAVLYPLRVRYLQ